MEKTIMVIEDEDDLRNNICRILNLLSLKTIEASDGEEGLKKILENEVDLIISDIKMPKMDGYMLLEEVGKIPEKNMIPFIFLTSNIERDQFRKGMNLGADDYITKPFEIDELASSIKTRLEKAGKLDEFYNNKFKAVLENLEEKYLINPQSGMPNMDQLEKDLEKDGNDYDNSMLYFIFDIEIDGAGEIISFFSKKSIGNFQNGIIIKLNNNKKDYSALYHVNDLEFILYSRIQKMFISSSNIDMYADEIITSIREPFASEKINISISASIGISMADENRDQLIDLVKNSKTAKLYAQKNGGNNFKIYNRQLQQVINKKLSTDLLTHLDMKTKQKVEKTSIDFYETKIFFIYPQSIIQTQLIKEIVKNEYAAYIVNDHEKILKLLEIYPSSILFINIDAVLSDEEWKKYISGIQNNILYKNIRIGILTHFSDEKKEEYYLMELMISCGYVKMKSNFKESIQIILKVLEVNEAKGKRKFVRVKCADMENVSCSLKVNNLIYKGAIIDISSAGMAFSLYKENVTYFKENTEIENIQLLLKGKICRLSGKIKGERLMGEDIIYVILFGETNYEETNKIHEFIFQALQDEINRELIKIS